MRKIRVSKKLLSKNIRQSDLRRVVRSELAKGKVASNLIQIAKTGYTSEQKRMIQRIRHKFGNAAAARQARSYRASNKANIVKAILRSKYGLQYAEREYRKILKKTTGEKGIHLTKAQNRARAKAYLNKLTAREFAARSEQAKEAIKLQRQFMKEKFNAIINAGLSLNLTLGGKHGIPIEEYIDKYWSFELNQLMEEYEENEQSVAPADLYNELGNKLTSGEIGHLQPLKQGSQYGYIDIDNGEIISPV